MNVRELLSKRPTAVQAVLLDASGRHETFGEATVLDAPAIARVKESWSQIGASFSLGALVEVAISDGAEASLFMFETPTGRTLSLIDAPAIDDIDNRAADLRALFGGKR